MRLALIVFIVACGGSKVAVDSSTDTAARADSGPDVPTVRAVPSGAMTRLAGPMLHNGPETYDNA